MSNPLHSPSLRTRSLWDHLFQVDLLCSPRSRRQSFCQIGVSHIYVGNQRMTTVVHYSRPYNVLHNIPYTAVIDYWSSLHITAIQLVLVRYETSCALLYCSRVTAPVINSAIFRQYFTYKYLFHCRNTQPFVHIGYTTWRCSRQHTWFVAIMANAFSVSGASNSNCLQSASCLVSALCRLFKGFL